MRKFRETLAYSFFASIFVTLGFALALMLVPQLTGQSVSAIDDAPAPITEADPALSAQEEAFANIYRNVAPSVVAITIQGRRSSTGTWIPISTGSGFVVDTEGHIVTNYHVVAPTEQVQDIAGEDAQARIEIRMFDGTIAEAEIIGTDPNSDIAVIQIDVPQDRLRPVAFGDSESMHEGQMVFALGNPFSNDWTLTSGIVSAVNRSIPGLDRYSIGGVIQTDAAINPGNSGGPLVNLNGEVVGVNSQINTETGANTGIGFAVPSNLVVKVAEALIEDGEIEYSYIGISSGSIDLSVIEAYNLPNNLRGVPVNQVVRNSPADNAGLESASRSSVDIITAVNGEPIEDFDELIGYLGIHTNPGDTVVFTVYRNGEILNLDVTLSSRP